jgi:hypothetical protein
VYVCDTGWDCGDIFVGAEDMSSRPRFLGPGDRTGTFTVEADSTGTGRGTWEPFIDTWNDRMGDLYPCRNSALPRSTASRERCAG